jgi:hypothetical protein
MTRRRSPALAALAALVLALDSRPALAKPKPDVAQPTTGPTVRVRSQGPPPRAKLALSPIVFTGAVEDVARRDMEAQLRAGLAQAAVDVVDPHAGKAPCAYDECAIERAQAVKATHVVATTITVDDKVYEVRIVASDARTQEAAAEVRETCEVCGATEVAELVRRQSAALAERVGALAPTPARVDVASEPKGAHISVDDQAVGRSPLRLELDAGPHRLRAKLDGYRDIEHRMVAVGGVFEMWSFRMQEAAQPKRRNRMRAAGWALVGIGSAAVVPGVVFLALDERPYRGRCSGDDVDADGDCRKLYDGVVYGSVLTAVGLALVAGGIGLVVAARRRGARQ